MTEYADPDVILQYHDVVLDAVGSMIDNSENVVEYNTIYANSHSTIVLCGKIGPRRDLS